MRLGILDFRVLRRFNPFNRHYKKVVATNTDGTDSYAEHGAFAPGSIRYGAAVYANGHVYLVPDSSDNVAKINVDTKVVTIPITVSLPTNAYISGVLAPNGKIYFIPRSANDIMVVDPIDDSYYFIPGLPTGTLKWQCASVNEEGMIYCIPRNNANVLKINTNSDTFTLIPHTTGTWFSSCLAQDGIIYAFPFSDTTILKIDTKTDTVSEFGSISGAAKWAGAVPVGHYIYTIPYRSSVVLKLDTRNDTFTTFGSLGTNNDKWYDGTLLENGFIYGCPSSSSGVIKIDPVNDTAIEIFVGELPGGQAWRGIANGGKGSLYCAPSGLAGFVSDEQILEITNDGVVNFLDEEFVKSAYYNKL